MRAGAIRPSIEIVGGSFFAVGSGSGWKADSVDRIEVSFFSVNANCAAWLYRPLGVDSDVPCVVMAHGFSLTRHDGLDLYAEAIAKAGVAVVVYDHRFLGDSEGQPRQRARLSEQLDDRRAAVAFARNIAGVDPNRIVVWGYSMSAGSAVETAAEDTQIAAAILLCPLLDGRWRSNRALLRDPGNIAWILGQMVRDTFGAAVIPATAVPGQRGMLTYPGEADGFRNVVAANSPWRNEVRAASTIGYGSYRPLTKARGVRCPVLIQAGCRDITVSPRAITKFGRLAPRTVVKKYDIDHFGAFHGDASQRVAADQAEWLRSLTL